MFKSKLNKYLSLAVLVAAIFIPKSTFAGTFTNFSVTSSDYTANASATYTIAFTTETAVSASPDMVMQVIFPTGFSGTTVPTDLTVTVNGVPATIDTDPTFGTFIISSGTYFGIRITSAVPLGSNVSITIPHMTNPSSNGSYAFSILRSADGGGHAYDNPATTPSILIGSGYNLIYSPADSNGYISGLAAQRVSSGGNGSAVTAVPATGYRFSSWSDGSQANPRTDTSVTSDHNVTASFAKSSHNKRTSFPTVYTSVISNPVSAVISNQVASVNTPIVVSEATSTPKQPPYQFTRFLRLGSVGDDVLMLQKFLFSHPPITSNGGFGAGNETKNFDLVTKNALIKFQEAHAGDILTPLGLTKGTGIFGAYTLKYVNKVLQSEN